MYKTSKILTVLYGQEVTFKRGSFDDVSRTKSPFNDGLNLLSLGSSRKHAFEAKKKHISLGQVS